MPEPTHPSIEELIIVLAHLADRVSDDSGSGLDPVVGTSLCRVIEELERHVPGLETPPDAKAALLLASSALAALEHGRDREALARALRGLSFAPHDPTLHYLVGSACLELGAPREAIAVLLHALWINPGHPQARRDLDTLTFLRERADGEEDDGWSREEWRPNGSAVDPPDETWEAWFDEDDEKRAA